MHDHHHEAHPGGRPGRRRRRHAVHRRAGQAPRDHRRLRPEHAVEGAPGHEDRDGRPRARRHRRDVPAPGAPDRRPRAGRLAPVQPGLPGHARASRRSPWSSSPTIAQSSPEYVNGVVAVATNSSSSADLGLFAPLNGVAGFGYIARRPGLRHRPVPRRHPRPLGLRPARGRRPCDHGDPPCSRWSTSACSPCPTASP